ncbi:TusE/DsrC/DsvC family sulfur relay protein [Sansalvadorimonas verongulae]|uniref:TusE/DsrC/DsvC family sulfur relay protein n=1 Tax=Sansalvadorimonas verongulae TaxID=2172824 RepID=UPI0012BC4E29|nr:TusE/DsrC/DsvC family sulfur relay protein [Sansalvadorimonas verongulae]MTI12342.1 TusE/DsrC/DsvC family sulfur relay protein [Sansalvadorimonas verongulae]
MKSLKINDTEIPLDNDGYLVNLSDWNTDTAHALAQDENISLDEAHWEIINLIRQFYQQYELAPSQRPMVRYVKENLGAEKGNSMYLMKLFPGSPAKIVSRIAGLPRPTNCF